MSAAETSASDAQLLSDTARGDRAALGVLVRRHGGWLHRHLRRMTADAALAEDALQDTFLAVLEHAGSFRGASSARAWLHTLARHALGRRVRRRVGEPSPAELDTDLEALAHRAGFGSATAGWASALEDREHIERSLASLSDDDREVLALVDAEGFTLEEAALSCALSEAALKSRLHRARLRFMAALRVHGGET